MSELGVPGLPDGPASGTGSGADFPGGEGPAGTSDESTGWVSDPAPLSEPSERPERDGEDARDEWEEREERARVRAFRSR